MSNTHMAVIATSVPPSLDLIAAGPEAHCVEGLALWLEKHPLQEFQVAEIVTRDPKVVAAELRRAESCCYLDDNGREVEHEDGKLWVIEAGPAPDDFTFACRRHVGALLVDDVNCHYVYEFEPTVVPA